MTVTMDSTVSSSLAFQVVTDDGRIVRARIDGRLAHRFSEDAVAVPLRDEQSANQDTSTAFVDGTTLANFNHSPDEPLADAIGFDAYQRRVLLNLSTVTGLDTSGINWLLTVQKRFDSAGGRLVLHSLSPAARTAFRALNLHCALRVAVDEVDAAQRM